jgi:hypothetical protein
LLGVLVALFLVGGCSGDFGLAGVDPEALQRDAQRGAERHMEGLAAGSDPSVVTYAVWGTNSAEGLTALVVWIDDLGIEHRMWATLPWSAAYAGFQSGDLLRLSVVDGVQAACGIAVGEEVVVASAGQEISALYPSLPRCVVAAGYPR